MINSELNIYSERENYLSCSVAEIANVIIESATECIDRGEHDGMKRGTCHVFRESDVCMCKKIDLRRYRLS
jgi:hypothetical protein